MKQNRMRREGRTVAVMIGMYCRKKHGGKSLCPECRELADYAAQRLAKCPFQDGKMTCGKCPVHCYKPAMREKIRAVMRYSGPRMILRHPVLAVWHVVDGRRKVPGPRVSTKSGV